MKKMTLVLIVLALTISMVFFSFGCKVSTVATETTAAATTAAQVTTAPETTAAETAVAETTAAAVAEPDSWFLEARKDIAQFRTENDKAFKGPTGQTPVWDSELWLTSEEVAKVREGNFKLALSWYHLEGEYTQAIIDGITAASEYLGMELVAVSSAQGDPAKQKSDVETIMALKPDAVIGFPVDPTTGAEAFRPVADSGTVLALVSAQPDGYVYGKDFTGIATNMPYDQGYYMAQKMVEIAGEKAKIGINYVDLNLYVTNVIDKGFREGLAALGPNIEVVSDMGFTEPKGAGANTAAALIQQPDIEALYITYMLAAMEAQAACKDAGRDDVDIITFAVDKPTLLSLINGENVKALITDTPWNIGVNLATICAYGLLGKECPEYVLSPATYFTQDNVRELYQAVMHTPVPEEIDTALRAKGM